MPTVGGRVMRTLFLTIVLAVSPALASNPNEAEQLLTYANNAILAGAEDGKKAVTLRFGDASPVVIEDLAQALRDRGYLIDEQAFLINPLIIKVRRLS